MILIPIFLIIYEVEHFSGYQSFGFFFFFGKASIQVQVFIGFSGIFVLYIHIILFLCGYVFLLCLHHSLNYGSLNCVNNESCKSLSRISFLYGC